MRFIFAFVLLLFAAEAKAASCAGRNLVADIKATDPAGYAQIEAKLAATPNAEGLLWRIEGAPKPSYLFGTMHVADPRILTLPEPVKAAMADSDRLAVEIAGLKQDELSAGMVKHAMVKKGGTIDDIPRKVRDQIKAAIQARGIPPEAAGHFQQWFLVLALALPPCAFRDMAGMKVDDVLDGQIEKVMRDAGKPVIGLETAEEQITIFKSLDKGLIRRWLLLTPEVEPLAEDLFETTIQLYLEQRVALLEYAMGASADLTPQQMSDVMAFTGALVDDRNVNMAKRAKAELDKGGVFIAVGALHLQGEMGLVELIRKAGFTVTRVP